MKVASKIVGGAMASLMVASCMVGCGTRVDENVESTIASIDRIGQVTEDSDDSIREAENEYNALSEKQKEAVTNRNDLAAAREAYDSLIEERVRFVEESISDIGEVTLDKKDLINRAEMAYKALSADEKKQVSNYDELKRAIASLDSLKKQEEEAAKAFAVGDSVLTDRWSIKCTDAYVSTTLESGQSPTLWTIDDGSIFLIMEFDVEALTSDKLVIDDYAIVDPVATYNGNTYKSFDMNYLASKLWLSAKRTVLEANMPVHIYVFAPLPASALDDGKPISVDLEIAGQKKHLDVR